MLSPGLHATCLVAAVALLLGGCAGNAHSDGKPAALPAPSVATATPAPDFPARLRREAAALRPLSTTSLARSFLASAAALPPVGSRMLYRTADKKQVLTAEAWARLPEAERAAFTPLPIDEESYWGRFSTPLAYARPLEVLGEAGVAPAPGTRLLDFGYGGAGHLRMLASLGFSTTGVDVDPVLTALYADPAAQGAVPGFEGAPAGALRLLSGRWPGDPALVAAVGGPYDVILSKNVLKKGYIHPDRPAEERFLIKLGVDDATFLRAVHDALRPGGLFLIYNICPAPTPLDKPFLPWSDGRSPFSMAAFEAAGLRVRILDRDDTEAIRKLGATLGWDEGEEKMDLENDLSVLYTLVERRMPPSPAGGVL